MLWWNLLRLRYGGPRQRQAAVLKLISHARDERATAALIAAASDPDRHVRDTVARALGWTSGPAAAACRLRLLDDDDNYVRASAVFAIGLASDGSAFDAVVRRMRDRDPFVRGTTARTLGQLGDARAIPVLREALADRDTKVVESAVEALGKLGVEGHATAAERPAPPATFAGITAELKRDFAAAGDAFMRAGAPAAARGASDESARQEFGGHHATWEAERLRIMEQRARELAALGTAAVPELLLLLCESDIDVQNTAKAALLAMGNQWRSAEPTRKVLEDLVPRLGEENVRKAFEFVGSSAAELLAERFFARGGGSREITSTLRLLSQTSVDALRKLLDRREEDLRPVVVFLGELGWKPKTPREKTLAAIFSSRSGDFYELKTPAAETLIELLEKRIRAADVARALGGTGDRRAIEPLVACFHDSDPDLRRAAIRAVGFIRDERSTTALLVLLSDSDPAIRSIACDALGLTRDERACEPLLAATADPSRDVRLRAVLALGPLGKGRAVPALIELGKDRDDAVRWAAASSLHELKAAEYDAIVDEILASASSAVLTTVIDDLAQRDDPRVVALLAERVSDDALRHLKRFGDERAVAPLLRIAASGSVSDVADQTVWTLTSIVSRHGARVSDNELAQLATLSNVRQSGDPDPDAPHYRQKPQSVDCSELNRLAAQELARRRST